MMSSKTFAFSVESEEKRLALFSRLLAVSVLLCIAFSWKLWTSSRLYPLVPLFGSVPRFPYPFDYLFLALFCAALVGVAVRPRSRILCALVAAAFAVLFLQDQNRIWPSFYEFFFLFLILAGCRPGAGADEAQRALMGARFVMAAVYFWSGALKLNTYFYHETFPWFFRPLTGLLPFDVAFMPELAVFGAVMEVSFGIGLLTRRLRAFALYKAMLMHALIFFLIGPLRDDWNDSAWIWSNCTAVLVWVLFRKAPAFEARKMLGAPAPAAQRLHVLPQALAAVFIGVLPLLNNFNLWDSALSFNIYTGNVNTAYIRMRPEVAGRLPAGYAPFLAMRDGMAVLDIEAWTRREFNANPLAERRLLKPLLDAVCAHAPDSSVNLVLREKAGWLVPVTHHAYGCGEM